MVTSYDKAIAMVVLGIASLGVLVFHWAVPGWLTETNIEQVIAVLGPIIVAITPNKVTPAQKVKVLTDAGVIPPTTGS